MRMKLKRKPLYELASGYKQQSPEIKAMLIEADKKDAKKAAAKKEATAIKQRNIWRRAKRRLKKLFGE